MAPAGPDGRQIQPRARSGLTGRQVLWASVPIWSIGFLSFVPFLAYAVSRGGRRAWAVFGGYLAATVAMVIALGTVAAGSDAEAGVGGYIIALAGCAAVHAAVLFRPAREVPADGAPFLSVRQGNQAAVAQAKDRIERRKEARPFLATIMELLPQARHD